MKRQLLTILTIASSVTLIAQTQLNVLTNFTDFAISTGTTNPIVMTSSAPVSISGTNCATGIFQKLYPAGQTYDSIVATLNIKTNIGSTITNYGQPVPVGQSNKKIKITNFAQLNVGFSLQFCGANDTISFSNLLVIAYGPQSIGINENRNEISKNIFYSNKIIYIKNLNLDNLTLFVYDLNSRIVYADKASETIETTLDAGLYILMIQDKEKNVLTMKKIYIE